MVLRYSRRSRSGRRTRSAWKAKAAIRQDPGEQRHDHARRLELAGRADLGEAVGEQRNARGHQEEPGQVEPLGLAAHAPRQEAQGCADRDDPDRDVDVEDPAPARVVDDQPAERRAEDRRQHRRDGDDAHHTPHPLGPGRGREHQLADRQEHAAAEPLQDPEADQLGRRGREAAEHRAGREEDEREDVDVLGAETARSPAGHGDHRGEREHVARQHPLDLRERRVQVGLSVSSATLTIVVSRIDMIEPRTRRTRSARRGLDPIRRAAPAHRAGGRCGV